MKEENAANYFIIFLVLALIAMFSYFSEEKKELEDIIYMQDEVIKDQSKAIEVQQQLINLLKLSRSQQEYIFPYRKQNDPNKIIKISSPQKGI